MKLSEREKELMVIAYTSGYEGGHNDTVESCYYDPRESAEEWVEEAISDGAIEYEYNKHHISTGI